MLLELRNKQGRLCDLARSGQLHCPLIVRPTSEDQITGQLVEVLQVLNPYWWLPDVLNEALGTPRFRRQVYRRLRIEPWQNMPCYPRELLPWDEGSTQVDVLISWENPPTTIFLEMKYGSDLSQRTAADNGNHGFSSDQLVRNARVGLWQCGYFRTERLFNVCPRDFVLILVSPEKGHPLVQEYRDPERLRAAIPHSKRIPQLPSSPFIGELSYRDIGRVLREQRRWFSRPERILLDLFTDYLDFKRANRPKKLAPEL
jgi:hypothetical protein